MFAATPNLPLIRLGLPVILFCMTADCVQTLRQPDLGELYDRAAQYHDENRNPVIVIPGMLGSRLEDSASGRVVWGAFTGDYANPKTPGGARLFALPMREGAALAELRDEVEPKGVLDRVQFQLFGLPVALSAYANILGTLGVGSYLDEALGLAGEIEYGEDHFTCFQFPYDFRRDIVESAQELHRYILEKKKLVRSEILRRFKVDKPDIKFDLVAHSMGGLVARYYLRYGAADLPEDGSMPEITWAGAEHLDRVILIGTPNAGSVHALIQLVEGTDLGPFLTKYPAAVLATLPSMYQLLPRERHGALVHTASNHLILDPTSPEVWERMGWGVLSPDQDRYLAWLLPEADDAAERQRIARDHVHKCLDRARRFHEALDAPAELPEGIGLFLFAGDAEQTEAKVEARYGSGSVRVVDWEPGDGTVLRSSALLDERVGQTWSPNLSTPIDWTGVTFLFTDHLGMTKDRAFSDNVLFILLENQ